jgi:hypothetical protein
MEQNPSSEVNSPSRKVLILFMEAEGSIPSSQERTTGPYPEPVESSPYRLTPLDPF